MKIDDLKMTVEKKVHGRYTIFKHFFEPVKDKVVHENEAPVMVASSSELH